MYIFQQLVFVGVYTVGCIAVAIALGIFFSKSRICLPVMTKFLFGFASTPFVIGWYMLLMGLIPFRLYNFVYYFIIYLLAFCYLYKERTVFLRLIQEYIIPKIPRVPKEYKWVLENIGIMAISHLLLIQMYDHVINKVNFVVVLFLSFSVIYLGKFVLKENKIKEFVKYITFSVEYIGLYGACLVLDIIGKDVFLGSIYGAIVKLILYCICCVGIVCINADIRYSISENEIDFREIVVYALRIFFLGGSFYIRNYTILARVLLFITFCMIFMITGIKNANLLSRVRWNKKQTECIIVCGIFALFYAILSQSLWPVVASDASEYMSNALEYIRDMSWSAINSYAGESEGKLLGIIHHPNYVLYLGFALLHSSVNKMGFPYDYAVRVAFSANIVYLIVAILGFSYLLKKTYKKYVILFFPFVCLTMQVILVGSSRDGYRVIPLVLFTGLLAGIMQSEEDSIENSNYILMTFFAASVMMGHPINAVQAVIIVLAYFLWCLLNKKIDKNVIKIFISGLVGAIIGAAQIIVAYIDTGRFTGELININELLEGTDYYNNFMNYSHSRLGGSETFVDRLFIIMSRDYGIVLIPALIIAIYILTKAIKKRNFKDIKVFMALIIIVQSLTFSDFLNWSGFSLTEWYVKNIRYTLQLYVFAGILIGAVLSEYLSSEENGEIWKASILRLAMFVPLISIITWNGMNGNYKKEYAESYQVANDVIAKMEHSGKKLMIDNYYCNYYLSNKAISFFTTKCKSIREAQTIEEFENALHEENIGAILIVDSFIDVYWKDSLLMEYLETKENVKNEYKNERLTVYELEK